MELESGIYDIPMNWPTWIEARDSRRILLSLIEASQARTEAVIALIEETLLELQRVRRANQNFYIFIFIFFIFYISYYIYF